MQSWVKKLARIPLSLEEVDEKLYTFLPMVPREELYARISAILMYLLGPDLPISFLDQFLEPLSQEFFTAEDVRKIAKAALLAYTKRCLTATDIHQAIVSAMQTLQFCMPRPIFFADTNWSNQFFGFVVSPSSEKLELWRLDYTGCTGRPMLSWKGWVDGSHQKPWGVFVRPSEYSN